MTAPNRSSAAHSEPRTYQAAAKATERNSTRVDVPFIGTVRLPPPEQLAYIGGIAVLTALEVIEWPVGLALAAGHLLAAGSSNKVMEEFGDALEEA